MLESSSQILLILAAGVFSITLLMNLARTNTSFINLYALQSLAVSVALFVFAFKEDEKSLFAVAFLALLFKVILAPMFFYRLIKKHRIQETSSSYLSTPLTLLSLTALTIVASPQVLGALKFILSEDLTKHTFFVFSGILLSLFLTINRKGAFSQVIGILSLENGIVLFSSFVGLKYSLPLELGIIFDIGVWILLAAVFLSMIYKHFGSLDVKALGQLKEK